MKISILIVTMYSMDIHRGRTNRRPVAHCGAGLSRPGTIDPSKAAGSSQYLKGCSQEALSTA